MEIVLEQPEIVQLLKEALEARGVKVPSDSSVRIRRNGKRNTMRIVFVGGLEGAVKP